MGIITKKVSQSIYEIEESKISKIIFEIETNVKKLYYEFGVRKADMRVLIPKHIIDCIEMRNRALISYNQNINITDQIAGVKVLEHYKNEVVVYSIYFYGNEKELNKIIELQ